MAHVTYERLMASLKELKGITKPKEAAAFLGEESNTVSNWKTRGVPEPKLRFFAESHAIAIEYLHGDDVPMTKVWIDALHKTTYKPFALDDGLSQTNRDSRTVPVISWVSAGMFDEAIDIHQPGVAEYWAECPKRCSEGTFALVVRGDSMTAQQGKSYPDGCLIFVDPDKRTPYTGQRVVAKTKNDNSATFKVFIEDAGKRWLKPLNDSYPNIYEEFTIIGTVVGKWEDD